jgi:hypothetical protein
MQRQHAPGGDDEQRRERVERSVAGLAIHTGHEDQERGGDDGRRRDVDRPHPSRLHHCDDTGTGHRAHRPLRVRALT